MRKTWISLFSFSSGGFAFVYEALDVGSGKEYALKVSDLLSLSLLLRFVM